MPKLFMVEEALSGSTLRRSGAVLIENLIEQRPRLKPQATYLKQTCRACVSCWLQFVQDTSYLFNIIIYYEIMILNNFMILMPFL